MNARNLKRIYRNFGKELIGVDLKIKIDETWGYCHTNQKIWVAKQLEDFETEEIIADFFKELLQKEYSCFTLGFLHEVGHYWSKQVYNITNEQFENALLEVEILNTVSHMIENFSKKRLMEEYYNIETEKLANDFVAMIVKNKPQVVAKYDDILFKIYGV